MPDTPLPASTAGRSRSAAAKILVLGLLALGLLVPVGFILALVHEREERQQAVEQEIATTWGAEQLLAGPVLSIPYRRPVEEENTSQTSPERTRWVRGEAIYLPAELEIAAAVRPETRSRGIFSTVVYLADISLSGAFKRPDPQALGLDDADLQWDEAKLLLTISDVHGLARPVELEWSERTEGFEPTRRASLPGVALATAVDGLDERPSTTRLPFSVRMAVRGSGALRFTPSARSTRIEVESPWPHPSFSGGFLPVQSAISEQGFTASWQVSSVARGYPQQWLEAGNASPLEQSLLASGLGVRLAQPADAYQQTERAAKYSILFITLTFATFLLCELTSSRRLHPIQYLLVGAALVVFYLLLLSLTEHFSFWSSYLAAAAATVLLVAGYARAILSSRRLALALLVWMSVLYGYLYVLLQLEDYALLAGSLGLFTLLAAFMWLTRRLDWSHLEFRAAAAKHTGSVPSSL
ncbi:MAG: cell envelope integrity protein CreD [Thermoanaerobaculia bacterium]